MSERDSERDTGRDGAQDGADDDYPVLTQILRTGGGLRIDTPVAAAENEPSAVLSVRPIDSTGYAEPFPPSEPDPSGSSRAARHDAGLDGDVGEADLAGMHALRADAFRLSQDHDGDPSPDDDALDEPAVPIPDQGELDRSGAANDRRMQVDRREDAAAGWAALSARVRMSVLEDVGSGIDTQFDARIAQVLHVEVETALGQLQNALREHLAAALRDVVSRAVDGEVQRLRGGSPDALPPDPSDDLRDPNDATPVA